MPNLTLSIPHQLGRDEARRRIQDQLAQLNGQYGHLVGAVQQSWYGDRMEFRVTAAGDSVSGRVFVENREVRVEVELPWMLAMLGGVLRREIERKGQQLLGHRR